MSDLVSRLLAAIEQEEQDAPNIHHKDCHSVSYVGVTEGAECDCGEPAAVLRRCAEDRRLVEWYEGWQKTFRGPIPEGHSEEGALHFRMASEYVITRLQAAYGLSVEEETAGE